MMPSINKHPEAVTRRSFNSTPAGGGGQEEGKRGAGEVKDNGGSSRQRKTAAKEKHNKSQKVRNSNVPSKIDKKHRQK